MYGHAELSGLLLAGGASHAARSQLDMSPLMIASHGGHFAVVHLLLRAGADSLAQTQEGFTARTFAEHKGRTAVAADLRKAEQLSAVFITTTLGSSLNHKRRSNESFS